VPNRACVEALLRAGGFTILGHPEEEVYICRAGPIPPAAQPIPHHEDLVE